MSQGTGKLAKHPIHFRPQEDIGEVKDQELHLLDYIRVIVRRRWVLIICFCTIMTSTAVFTFLKTPIYQATCRIRIYKEAPKVLQFAEVAPKETGEYMKSEVEELKSRSLAKKVVKRLHLDLHPEFTGASSSPSIWNLFGILKKRVKEGRKEEWMGEPTGGVVDAFLGRISVKRIRGTQLVMIGADAIDRNLSALMANALADEYIQHNIEARVFMGTSASDELAKQLEELKNKLEKSEKKLYEYAKKHNMVALGETENLLASKINALNQQLSGVAAERIKAETLYIRSVSHNPGYLPAIVEFENIAPLEEKYADINAEYMKELQRVKPAHQNARQLKAKLDVIAKEIERERQKITDGIKEKYGEVVEREKGFNRQMEDLLAQKENLGGKLVKYRILKREVDTNTQLYNALLQRMKETTIASEIKAPNVVIVDRAAVPSHPYKPKKKLNLMVAAIASLFLGVGLAFFIDYLDTSVKSQEDIEGKIGLTFLGAIPSLEHGKKGRYY